MNFLRSLLRWCTAYPSRTFLIGMLAGMVTMGVRCYKIYTMPVIIAEPCDNVFERYTRHHTFFIKDCPKKGKTLQIQIRTQDEVREYGRQVMGEDVPGLLGYADIANNKIICVNSIEVLIHEIRHIFEGLYHRSLPESYVQQQSKLRGGNSGAER